MRDFPGVLWVRLCTSTAGDAGSIPDWGTKILHAVWQVAKTWGKKKKTNKNEQILLDLCSCGCPSAGRSLHHRPTDPSQPQESREVQILLPACNFLTFSSAGPTASSLPACYSFWNTSCFLLIVESKDDFLYPQRSTQLLRGRADVRKASCPFLT